MSRRVSLPAVTRAAASAGVVDVLTGAEPIVTPVPAGVLSIEDARELTHRIRQTARDVADRVTRLLQLVDQAIGGEAWATLGFASPAAYIVDVVEPMRLPVDQRRLVVGWLTGRGMSTRAIAPIVQVDPKTVVNDRRAIADAERAAGVESSTPAPARVQGIDGRSYPAEAARPNLVVVPSPAATPSLLPMPSAASAGTFLELLAARLEEVGQVTIQDWVGVIDVVGRGSARRA